MSLLERPVSKQAEVVARVASRLLTDGLTFFLAMWFAYWLRFENAYVLRTFPPEKHGGLQRHRHGHAGDLTHTLLRSQDMRHVRYPRARAHPRPHSQRSWGR